MAILIVKTIFGLVGLLTSCIWFFVRGSEAMGCIFAGLSGGYLFLFWVTNLVVKETDQNLEQAKLLILDVFNQSCRRGTKDGKPMYSHDYLSDYQEAQAYLLEHGLITKDQCYYD